MKSKTKYIIKWQEIDLDFVIRYFTKDFTGMKSGDIVVLDTFIDRQRGKIIFKFLVRTKSESTA